MPFREDRSSSISVESGGRRWDSDRFLRERERRAISRGPPVRERERERPRRREEERFEQRLAEEQRHGPLSRRPRFDADDHHDSSHGGAGPLVAYNARRRPSSPPPRLVRRQSSLDTFLDQKESRRRDRSPPMAFRSPRPKQPSVVRHVERDEYEDIRIAEPDYYGDEEYRNLRDRERLPRRMRRRSTDELFREKVVEKTYPRKGKTRMPRRLVHFRAVNKLGYPYVEEDDVIVIQKALSKEQIDDVVTLSRKFREKTESVSIQRSPSPSRRRLLDPRTRAVRDALVVERAPSVHRARSQMRTEIIEKKEVQPRSASVNYWARRDSSPVRIVERRDDRVDAAEAVSGLSGAVVLAERPRRTNREVLAEIRALEDERRLLQFERRDRDYNAEIIRDTTTDRKSVV